MTEFSYSPTQRQTVICMLSYMSAFAEGSAAELQRVMAEKLDLMFQLHDLQDLIGHWEVVWGPAIFQAHKSDVADNTMFIARCLDEPKLVISIAGTNPYSWFNWLIEDLPVRRKEAWPTFDGGPPQLEPKISQGTGNGLRVLQRMKVDGKTVVDFLQSYLTTQTEPLEIIVTGHSLGGALSPAMAVYLADTQSIWDSEGRAKVALMPIAGPTPGNVDFATYGEKKLNGRIERIWNQKDIVPHAWDKELMKELRTLYEPTIKPSWLTRFVIFLTRRAANRSDYGHLQPDAVPLPGEVVPTSEAIQMLPPSFFNRFLPKYMVQMGYQHLEAYYQLLEMEAFARIMGDSLPDALSGPDLAELRRRVTEQEAETPKN